MSRARLTMLVLVLSAPLSGSGVGRAAAAAGGGVAGVAAGTAVTLGVVVARARLAGHYVESTRDLLSAQGLPIPIGAVGGAAATWSGGRTMAALAAGTGAGLVLGAGAGAALGIVASEEPEDAWAGGVMGGALGVLIGVVLGLVLARRSPRGGVAVPLLVASCVAVQAACGSPEPEPGHPERVVAVAEDESPVESVVFLVGDPGKARAGEFPILERLATDVNHWAARLPSDSAAVVAMLGDIVYPDGMHPPEADGYAVDSARVADQVAIVAGAGARQRGARMVFLAGNHDWGLAEDRTGARRLRNLGDFLDGARERGLAVDLIPPAGSGMPHVMDLGRHLRLVLLDTAWWLFDAEPAGKEAMVEGVASAVAGAGSRHVVIAAHHPFESAGPHGGLVPFWRTVGVKYLLNRSGALLQDLSSRPYAELKRALGDVFRREGRPLVFAGGHEHSLQVIRHAAESAPRYSIVSGSASKLTGVGPLAGMMVGASLPGYVRLVVRENGAVDVFVEAAPARYLSCPEAEGPTSGCVAEATAAYRTIFSTRLAPARP